MMVSQLIRSRRAVRQFTGEPLSEEAIRSILNVGSLPLVSATIYEEG